MVDGDTLHIGPVTIRLHGIDAPEAGQHCPLAKGGQWSCGDDATRRLAALASKGDLSCTARDRDAYGRIVAVCSSSGGEDLSATLAREGLAWAYVRYSDDLRRRGS